MIGKTLAHYEITSLYFPKSARALVAAEGCVI
jgi:hypothetical protein